MNIIQQMMNPQLESLIIQQNDEIKYLQDQVSLAQCVLSHRNKTMTALNNTSAEAIVSDFMTRFATKLTQVGVPAAMER